MTRVHGGTPLAGAAVGILMLDSRFPRIPGDMGNALSWPFPVHYRVVRGATPQKIVSPDDPDLLRPFFNAAKELVADGVKGVTTTCGFLTLYQKALSEALPVPVVTSSLMQVDMVNRILPQGRRAGVLTISASALTADHLAAANVPDGTPIGTTEGGQEFTKAILSGSTSLDVTAAEADIVTAARAMQDTHTGLGAIVLECTNMVPYADAVAAATGLPVYSIHTLITWFHSSLAPPRFTL